MSTIRRIFQVHCPSCSTEFPIDSGKLPENGVAAICSVCLRVFPVHHPPEELGGESISLGASEGAVDGGLIAEEVIADDWASESEPEPDSEETDFVVVDMVIEGDPLVGVGLEAEVEELGDVDDDPSNPFAAEMVYEAEVIETEVVIEEFTFEDEATPRVSEDAADSIEDEAVAEVELDVTDERSEDFLDGSAEEPAVAEVELDETDERSEDFLVGSTEEPAVAEVEPDETDELSEDFLDGSAEKPVVAEPEPEPVPEAPSEPEVSPVSESRSPSSERPVFEDLSSFTNEVLAESSSEAAEPVIERSRPSPEKLERFGRRDPHERARHLARVLVSDIIAYYPVRYQESLARRTLPEDFADEIQKSYREFVDQVGIEMAESTPYFVEALNHVLGRGEKFF